MNAKRGLQILAPGQYSCPQSLTARNVLSEEVLAGLAVPWGGKQFVPESGGHAQVGALEGGGEEAPHYRVVYGTLWEGGWNSF